LGHFSGFLSRQRGRDCRLNEGLASRTLAGSTNVDGANLKYEFCRSRSRSTGSVTFERKLLVTKEAEDDLHTHE